MGIQSNDSIFFGYFCIGFIDFIFANKKWLILQSYFLLLILKKMTGWFWKMNESNYIEAFDRTNLTDLTKFRLNEISKIENYFNQEIEERKINSKKLSKYVAAFDYIDKISIALSATSGGISIISFTTVIGTPVGIANASFAFIISLTTGIIKKQ